MTRPQPRSRLVVLALICLVAIGVVAGYVVSRRQPAPARETEDVAEAPLVEAAPLQGARVLLFRNTNLGAGQGRASVVGLDDAAGTRYMSDLVCERVHYAGGHGVCLAVETGMRARYLAHTFDASLARRRTVPLPGLPSRVRVAPSGRRAGITVFVTGDSYASGGFSTRTFLIDTETGQDLGDLERFAITRNGQPFSAIDFNFWGVTFQTDRVFYATLGTGGRTYLIRGDADARSAVVVADDVECPALSLDGTRIAFKQREHVDNRVLFHLQVLDLATGARTSIADSRNIDDQVEWLDDSSIMYGVPSDASPGGTDVWTVAADGTGAPRLLVAGAWSPSVIAAGALALPVRAPMR